MAALYNSSSQSTVTNMFSRSRFASIVIHTILICGSSSFQAHPARLLHKRFTPWCQSSFSLDAADEKQTSENDCDCPPISETDGPDILKPFLPAMDQKYSVRGPVGQEKFILSRSGGPTAEELKNEQMLKIVKIECSDLEVNTLVWKCMGYRFNEQTEEWENDEVFPKWREKYPTPPDLIGMKRVYERDVDQISLRSNQALVRSIPADNKQSLKKELIPLGWTGYQVSCLQCCFSVHFALYCTNESKAVDHIHNAVQGIDPKQDS